MLVLGRKVGQVIYISLAKNVDESKPIGEVFRDGPMELKVTHWNTRDRQIHIGLKAPRDFLILRAELAQKEQNK